MGRFGISAYSRSQDRATIKNEELLVDKETGQMLIKTTEINGGDIISYDNILTQQQTIQIMQNTAILNGLKGDILSIDLEVGAKYPVVIDANADVGINLLSGSSIDIGSLLTGDAKNFFALFNIMTIQTNEDGGVLTTPATVEFVVSSKGADGQVITTTVKSSAYEPTQVLDTSDLGTEVKITSVKISLPNLPTVAPDGSAARYRHILTNFLIFVEKEGL